jgi:hypothetical protein
MHPYRTATERLLHRWFVQYNPLYIASAVLVLVGITLMNKGLAHDPSHLAMFGPRLVTEVYALALIGAAAILTRHELRRPAWFVAMFAVIYQGDLTLGTETYALLRFGVLVSALWLALFVIKLHALAAALRMQLSLSARVVPVMAASALAAVPHLHRRFGVHALSVVVAAFVFATADAALSSERRVTSGAPLTPWQGTVLRRSLRAVWTIWAILASSHLLFWAIQYRLELTFFLPASVLVARRWLGQRPMFATYATGTSLMLLIKIGLVRSALSWGVTTVAVGFALLLLAMVTSFRIERECADAHPHREADPHRSRW